MDGWSGRERHWQASVELRLQSVLDEVHVVLECDHTLVASHLHDGHLFELTRLAQSAGGFMSKVV